MTRTLTEMRGAGKPTEPRERTQPSAMREEITRTEAAAIAKAVEDANRLWPDLDAKASVFLSAGWSADRVTKHLWNCGVDLSSGDEISGHIMPDAGLNTSGAAWNSAVAKVNAKSGS